MSEASKDKVVEQEVKVEEELPKEDNKQDQKDNNSEEKPTNEESKEDIEVEEKEDIVETQEVPKPKKGHDVLIDRLNNTQAKADDIYAQYEKLDKELEEKAVALIRQENNILKTTIANSLELLKELKVDSLEDEEATINEIALDNKEEKLHIKYPSKGTFKGLVCGAIATAAGVIGSFAVGVKLSNIAINAQTIMQKSSWDSVATTFSKLININTTPMAGYALIGVGSLLLGLIVYKLTTWLQKIKNNKYVNSLENNLEEYSSRLENKMAKMRDLIEHSDNIKLVMEKYDIILQEQNAKIRRMLFIEQPQSVEDLQRASKLEVDKTILILDELLKLMNTPISEGIEIEEESKERLKNANSVINEVIKKLYI